MNARVAKKIVKYFREALAGGPVLSHTIDQIRRAHGRIGLKLSPEDEAKWREVKNPAPPLHGVKAMVEAKKKAVKNIIETHGVEAAAVQLDLAPGPDFASMKVAELKKLAKKKGIKGYSRMVKDELIENLAG